MNRQYRDLLIVKEILIIVSLAVSLLLITFNMVYADEKYTLNDDGTVFATLAESGEDSYTLTVTGTGAIKDYTRQTRPEWWDEYRTKISTVTITGNITSIGSFVFSDLSNIQIIKLNEGLLTINSNAFLNTQPDEIEIPQTVTTINDQAFGGNRKSVITILGSDTVLKQNSISSPVGKEVKAFEDSVVAKNWIEKGTDSWGWEISNPTTLTKLPSYTYNEDRTEVSRYLANGKNVTIPDSVLIIGENTFDGNTILSSVDLNKVTTIKAGAFNDCSALKKAIVPGNVTSIDDTAFSNCNDDLVIFGNRGTSAESFASSNSFAFQILKPYRMDTVQATVNKEVLTNSIDVTELDKVFTLDYNAEIKYQLKDDNGDYQDIEGTSYSFKKESTGEFSLTFRAVDSYNEQSDDTFTVNYSVVTNSAPVIDSDKSQIEETVLFGEERTIDLSGIFTDNEGDELSYKYIDGNNIIDGNIDWEKAKDLTVNDSKFITPFSWTYSPLDVGKRHEFFIKAYDKWNEASEGHLTVALTMHSVKVSVTKGSGVHSLDGISFRFTREDAEDITEPAVVDDSNIFFDLDYNITYPYGEAYPQYWSFAGGYDYTCNIQLVGCEDIAVNYSSKRSTNPEDNTIEVTLSNPEQAEADAKAVADLIKAIDNLGDITLDSEEAVGAAQAAYEALYDDLKPQVTNYEVLHLSKLVLSSLKAQKAAEEAQAAAEEAERKAKIEQQNAKDAQDKAETAQQKAEEAQSKAETALEAAETAKGEAEAAKQAAETAKGEAEAAKQAAETAKGEAEAAKLEAETAKAEAETAKQAAETAKAEAEAAQQKAEKAAQEASSSDSETSKQIKELQDTLEKTAAELAALKDTLTAKENKVTGLKLKSKARKITVTWKKNADADGYQVQFKLKSAKKYKTLKTLTGIKAVSKKLKKGKKYQFRVATYKTVNGKKIYGKWVTKTVKCK